MKLPIAGTGPPSIPEGKGRKVLTTVEPFRLVSLDAATFDWLWRVVENRAYHHQETKGNGVVHDLQAQVSLRAALAFREAAGTLDQKEPKPGRRRLVKTPQIR